MTEIFRSPRFLDHDTGAHPECAARLHPILRRLDDTSRPELRLLEPSHREVDKLLADVHTTEYLKKLERFADRGTGRIEADTVVCPESLDVARLAVSAALHAVDDVLEKRCRNALCLVRPPGHHARPTTAMGFCLFANIAIAAKHAMQQHRVNRVLIVDWDVHHGNGTQEIFYDSDRVAFVSVHRHPFYPGTGMSDETGTGAGLGSTFNLPLEFGTPRQQILDQFATYLHDAAARVRPELVLLSAGFDAHRLDPIGSLKLETEDFGTLTRLVTEVADQYCDGRLVSLLEGGYNPTALAESLEIHIESLIDADP